MPHFFDAIQNADDLALNVIDDGEDNADIDDIVDNIVLSHNNYHNVLVHEHQFHYNSIRRKPPNYEALKPFFLDASTNVIKHTFDATTQFARTVMGGKHLRKTFKTTFPVCNVHRRNEAIATDTVYSDVPAIDNGSTMAQIFVGRDSLVTDVYDMKTEKQFLNTLEDKIRKRVAMDKLISDRAQVDISKRCLDILRAYCIDDWQSQPNYQHQNYAERRYVTIKPLVNLLLNQ